MPGMHCFGNTLSTDMQAGAQPVGFLKIQCGECKKGAAGAFQIEARGKVLLISNGEVQAEEAMIPS